MEKDINMVHIFPNGVKIYFDRPDKLHYHEAMDSFYESFSPFLNKEMWVMDIGTSCGDSTVTMGACLSNYPNSRILAFEPAKEIYHLLSKNLSENPFVTYDIHTVAVGDKNQLIDFVYGTDNGGLVLPEFSVERGNGTPSYKTNVVNGYEYLKLIYKLEDLDKIQFIKIDTEGYDYMVLRGLYPLIHRNKMPIMVEWWIEPNNSNLMFDEIEKLNYYALNTKGENVTRFDFNTPKKTQDLFLYPL